MLQSHPVITERFLSIVSEEGAIIIPFVTDFLVKSKKVLNGRFRAKKKN